jgi:hypothetical protein
MTDLARELELAEWLATVLDTSKPLDKWGFGDLGRAGILIAVRSLAEAERHNEAVEKLLGEIRDRVIPIHIVSTVTP